MVCEIRAQLVAFVKTYFSCLDRNKKKLKAPHCAHVKRAASIWLYIHKFNVMVCEVWAHLGKVETYFICR